MRGGRNWVVTGVIERVRLRDRARAFMSLLAGGWGVRDCFGRLLQGYVASVGC